jgi:hypothetical protein
MAVTFDYNLDFLKDIFKQSKFEPSVTEALGLPPVQQMLSATGNTENVNTLTKLYENAPHMNKVLANFEKDLTEISDIEKQFMILYNKSSVSSKGEKAEAEAAAEQLYTIFLKLLNKYIKFIKTYKDKIDINELEKQNEKTKVEAQFVIDILNLLSNNLKKPFNIPKDVINNDVISEDTELFTLNANEVESISNIFKKEITNPSLVIESPYKLKYPVLYIGSITDATKTPLNMVLRTFAKFMLLMHIPNLEGNQVDQLVRLGKSNMDFFDILYTYFFTNHSSLPINTGYNLKKIEHSLHNSRLIPPTRGAPGNFKQTNIPIEFQTEVNPLFRKNTPISKNSESKRSSKIPNITRKNKNLQHKLRPSQLKFAQTKKAQRLINTIPTEKKVTKKKYAPAAAAPLEEQGDAAAGMDVEEQGDAAAGMDVEEAE